MINDNIPGEGNPSEVNPTAPVKVVSITGSSNSCFAQGVFDIGISKGLVLVGARVDGNKVHGEVRHIRINFEQSQEDAHKQLQQAIERSRDFLKSDESRKNQYMFSNEDSYFGTPTLSIEHIPVPMEKYIPDVTSQEKVDETPQDFQRLAQQHNAEMRDKKHSKYLSKKERKAPVPWYRRK